MSEATTPAAAPSSHGTDAFLARFRPAEFVARLAARLVPRRLANDPLWRSLNFITHGDLVRLSRRHGLSIDLAPKQLHDVFPRLDSDGTFAARHRAR